MNRLHKEQWEQQQLHPAGSRSTATLGRQHAERPDEWRTCFERDRDRVIHCSAFRRLMYKTQVFINHVGDNQRTRMTHSLEVVQVSRSLASALRLNEALCETLALAHDLGHPPYGHSGEAALDQCMQDFGGFDHNAQSLRVVDVLERRSPDYRGLNLSAEVRAGLRKHQPQENAAGDALYPMLEAQLVDLADSTAYHYHDIDDGIREVILDPVQMERDLPLWAMAVETTRQRHPELDSKRLLWQRAANELLGMTIADIREESQRRLDQSGAESSAAAQAYDQRLIGHSADFRRMVAELHEYLYQHMYYREEVNWHVRRSTDLLVHLCHYLFDHPVAVPASFTETADSKERAVCDFLAGMTDRYVEKVSRELGILPSY